MRPGNGLVRLQRQRVMGVAGQALPETIERQPLCWKGQVRALVEAVMQSTRQMPCAKHFRCRP
jgi:hypothetical protein